MNLVEVLPNAAPAEASQTAAISATAEQAEAATRVVPADSVASQQPAEVPQTDDSSTAAEPIRLKFAPGEEVLGAGACRQRHGV